MYNDPVARLGPDVITPCLVSRILSLRIEVMIWKSSWKEVSIGKAIARTLSTLSRVIQHWKHNNGGNDLVRHEAYRLRLNLVDVEYSNLCQNYDPLV